MLAVVSGVVVCVCVILLFKQKTAYEMRISDWSSDVCSSDLTGGPSAARADIGHHRHRRTQDLPDDVAHRAVEAARCVHFDDDQRRALGSRALQPPYDI